MAHIKAKERYKFLKNASKFSDGIGKKIAEKLRMDWSPEQIRGHFLLTESKFFSFSTIYHWIRKGFFGNISKHLRRAGKPYKRRSDVNIIQNGTSIHDRDLEVNNRSEFGHWELDTVVGPSGTKAGIVTIVERKTRYLLSTKIEKRTAKVVTSAVFDLLKSHDVKSLTFDNGKEFSSHEQLGILFNCPTYFADPHSPWQRGSNENTNGLIRQYFPKGTHFEYINDEAIQEVVQLINSRPRKVLNFLSANAAISHLNRWNESF